MLNLKIYAIIAVLVIAAGVGFKVYFDYSQEQIKTLTADNQSFKIQNEAQQKVFNELKIRMDNQIESLDALSKEMNKIKKESTKLSKTLARHELDRLAGAKPGLIERLANKATKKVFAELEEISQPVEKETK